MPSIVSNLSEALGPVVTASGEDLDRLVGEMDLDPVTVEFDLVEPAFAARHLFDGCREGWFDEAGIRCLDANRDRLLALKCHALLAA